MKRTLFVNWRLAVGVAVFAGAAGGIKLLVDQLGLAPFELTSLTGSVLSAVTFALGFMLNSLMKDYNEAEKLPLEIAAALKNLADDGEYFAHQLEAFDDTELRSNLLGLAAAASRTITTKTDEQLDVTLRAVLMSISDLDRAGAPPNHTVRMKGDVFNLRRALERTRYIRKIAHLPTANTLVISIAVVALGYLVLTKSESHATMAVATSVFAYLYCYLYALILIVENPFDKTRRHSHDDVSLYQLREAMDYLERPS